MLVLKPKDTRIKNATTLLHLLLKQDSISRVELSRITGLTKTTVSSIINQFISLEIVEEAPLVLTGNVGKSPVPLHIRADAIYTIGVHIGRQSLKAVLIDARMNIILRGKELPYERLVLKDILKKLFESIDYVMKDAKERQIKVGAIGIGIPGPLDAQTGVVRHPPKFKGWNDVPLGKIVHERYGLPVWIENDANTAVLAEKWHGGGKKLKNFMYILLNEGIGAGIVINDELYQGAYDYVGEMGHILFYDRGKFRYLEDISGIDIIIKRARSQGLDIENIDDIPEFLQANNEVLSSIVRDIATWIGAAITNTIHIIGPQAVFVGGKMAATLGDALIQPIEGIVSAYLFGDQKVDVKLSEIPKDAVAIGAAIYTTTRWLEKKITGKAHV